MKDSYNQQFDYLIKDMTKALTESYAIILNNHAAFKKDVDTSPLLNLTLSVYMSSLIHVLDIIKTNTIGEVKLMENIELAKKTLSQSIKSLPFIKAVEEI